MLKTYTGKFVTPRGESKMKFQYERKLMLHNFIITNDSSPNVLWRDVLETLRLNWDNLFSAFVCKTNDNELNRLLSQYTDVLNSE